MRKTVCYPVSSIDKKIAQDERFKSAGYVPAMIANLRALYDSSHAFEFAPDTMDDETIIAEKLDTLYEYYKNLRDKDRSQISNTGNMYADAFLALVKSGLLSEERKIAADIVAQEFAKIVRQKAKDTGKSKLEICKNEFVIFEEVYNNLIDAVETDDTITDDEADFLNDILDNFGALSVYARVILKNTENLILGSNLSYASSTTEENWEEIVYADFFDVEEETKESWQESANAKSAYSRVGEYTRYILSTIEIPGRSVAGYPIRYTGQQVHQHLANMFRGMKNSNRMMTILQFESKEGDAIATAVLAKLAEDPLYQRCLYADFKHGFTTYSETNSSDKKNSIFGLNNPHKIYYNRYIHDVTSGEVSAESIFYRDSNTGEILVDTKKLLSLQRDSDKFTFSTTGQQVANAITQNIFKQAQEKQVNRKTQLVDLANLINKHAIAWGIPLSATTITELLSKAKTRNALLKAFQSLYDKDGVSNIIDQTETLGVALTAAALVTKEMTQRKGSDQVEVTTNVQKALSKILELAESLERNSKYPSTARAKSKKGKDTTLHSNHPSCFMTDLLDPIIEAAKEGNYAEIARIMQEKYGDNPVFFDKTTGKYRLKWMQDLVTPIGKDNYIIADNFEHTRTVQHVTPTGKIISTENTSEQQKWTILATMYASTQGSNYDNQFAWYPVFVLGDSGSYRWIKAPKYSLKNVVDGMYEVFVQECLVKQQIDSINNTITTGSKIQFGKEDGTLFILPFLRYSDYGVKSADDIKEEIKAFYEKAYKEKLQQLETQGLIAKNKEGKWEDKAGIMPSSYKNRIEQFVEEWTYNSEFATMQQLQMMTVSPAFYKDPTDLQKRYKEIHASGSSMDAFGKMTNSQGQVVPIFDATNSEGAYETVIYFNDIRLDSNDIHSDLLKLLGSKNKSVLSKYTDKGSTLTDGQGYRTFASYRKIAMAQGRWNEKGPEEAVWKWIQEMKKPNISEERKRELTEKILTSKVVFQPEKPFLFTHEKVQTSNGESAFIPVQHKCSEIVLIPELLPAGSNLQNLAYAMENQGIDAAYSTTVVKVGMFGETELEGANDIESMTTAVQRAYKHSLNLSNYYRQQNVPEHVNMSRQLGTQVMKTPFIDLDLSGNTIYDYFDPERMKKSGGRIVLTTDKNGNPTRTIDNPKNGRGLLQFYNALICSGIIKDFKKYVKSIKDTQGLSTKLQQIVLSNSRNTLDSLFAYSMTEDNSFLIPLFEMGVEHDTMSLLLSWMRKQVLHRVIAGGSAVQASAYGISRIETDEKDDGKLGYTYAYDEEGKPANIIHMEAELSWDLTYTDASGNTVELDYYKYCDNDGNLLTNTNGEILLDIDYPGIRNIVAYRIPTENNYSVMNLTIKRFSKKTVGGVIKVPVEGTTIAGFDFDVDKLYLVRKEFKSNELSKDQISEIWKKLYSDNRDIFETLLRTRKEIENTQDDIDTILRTFFSDNETAASILEGHGKVRRLYLYWEEAHLTESTGMTYTEFFNSYYNEHKKEFGFEEFDTYDYSKPINSQSSVAKNNEILNILQHRLMDPGTIKSRTTPGGFDTASRVGKLMRILESGDQSLVDSRGNLNMEAIDERLNSKNKYLEERRVTDMATWVAYSQQNQVAGALIGIFANHNTNNMYAKMAYKMGYKEAPVTINGKSHTNLIKAEINTIQTLAELLAASVDAVKDPVLNYFNLNTYTASTAAMLARLGYELEEIGLFLKQPIIVELCEMLANNSRETIQSASKKLKEKYKDSMSFSQKADMATTLDVMRQNIYQYASAKKTSKDAIDKFFEKNGVNQAAILDMFMGAQASVNELNGFIATTKFTAANSVGSTAGDVYESLYRAQKYATKDPESVNLQIVIDPVKTSMSNLNTDLSITDEDSYLEQIINNPFAFEQCMYDAIKASFMSIANTHFAYETSFYKYNREYLNRLSRSQALDADTINKAHLSLYQYLIESLEGSIFDPNVLLPDGTPRKQYYMEKFPSDMRRVLAEEQQKAKESNTELSRLGQFLSDFIDIYSNKGGQLILNVKDNMKMTVDQKNDFTAQWETLYWGTEKEQAFAEDLFLYTYFKSGFRFGIESFSHLIPNSIKSNIIIGNTVEYQDGKSIYKEQTFADFLREVQKGKVLANFKGSEWVKRFLLDNLANSAFTARFYNKKDLQQAKGITVSNDTITINIEEIDTNAISTGKISWGTKDIPRYAPIIINDGDVYMLTENSWADPECFSINHSNILTYNKVGTLTEAEKLQLGAAETNASQEDITMTYSPSKPGVFTRTKQRLFKMISSEFDDPQAALDSFTNIPGSTLARLIAESMANPEPVLDKNGNETIPC